MERTKGRYWLLTALALCLAGAVFGAPFNQTLRFTQPDGTTISIRAVGDECYARFWFNGYSLVYSPEARAYCYARLNADKTALEATGARAGVDPVPDGIGPDEESGLLPSARAAQAKARFDERDAAIGMTKRWNAAKAEHRASLAAPLPGAISCLSVKPVTGVKVGLTLLVDFPDKPASPELPPSEIAALMNQASGYTNFQNRGSVREYYLDQSNGHLDYTNVVTYYVRAPHAKSHYCDLEKIADTNAYFLISDVLGVLATNLSVNAALHDEYRAAFDSLSTTKIDGTNLALLALNVLYAGDNGDVWNQGLWPHMGCVNGDFTIPLTDLKVYNYEMTNIGSNLVIGTICHENGHMLMDFNDMYDYDDPSSSGASSGGAGWFCLMGAGNYGQNGAGTLSGTSPVNLCAYMKYIVGWTTPREFAFTNVVSPSDPGALWNGEVWSGSNTIYRYANPASVVCETNAGSVSSYATEYYLIENRQGGVGRDYSLPASGIAIWHVDELGDHNNENLEYNSEHKNYECGLVQADGRFSFERTAYDIGDAYDLWYAGNTEAAASNGVRFGYSTVPSSRWWDGSASRLNITNFSVHGATMTFTHINPYDAWKADCFGDRGHADDADDDADGLGTVQEFVFGADPHSADSELSRLDASFSNNNLAVSFNIGDAARSHGVRYDLEANTNLQDASGWSSSGLGAFDETRIGAGDRWKALCWPTNAPGALCPRRFFRLRARLPD